MLRLEGVRINAEGEGSVMMNNGGQRGRGEVTKNQLKARKSRCSRYNRVRYMKKNG